MTTATVQYQGNLRTQALHLASNNQIITDAPADNHGKGEAFSPTDLLATSLASCMLTIIGIKAAAMDVDVVGTKAEVTKIIASDPRRVIAVKVNIEFTQEFDERTRKILEAAALACPVAKSLHPDINQDVTFSYTNNL